MTRTILLMLSASALTLAACAEERSDAELGADEAAGDTRETMDGSGGDDTWNDADAAMDGDNNDGGMRYTEGDETPDEDDLGQSPPVNLAQDMAGGAAGLAAGVIAGLSGDVDAYVRNVTLGNMYEIQAGRIAMERGNSDVVREIGQALVTDHERLQRELEAAIEAAGLDQQLPTELEGRRQGLIDNLDAASDMDFDAAFLHQQEAAHLEAVALHEGFEASGDVDALTGYAGEAGNVVQGHLSQVTRNLGAAVDGE